MEISKAIFNSRLEYFKLHFGSLRLFLNSTKNKDLNIKQNSDLKDPLQVFDENHLKHGKIYKVEIKDSPELNYISVADFNLASLILKTKGTKQGLEVEKLADFTIESNEARLLGISLITTNGTDWSDLRGLAMQLLNRGKLPLRQIVEKSTQKVFNSELASCNIFNPKKIASLVAIDVIVNMIGIELSNDEMEICYNAGVEFSDYYLSKCFLVSKTSSYPKNILLLDSLLREKAREILKTDLISVDDKWKNEEAIRDCIFSLLEAGQDTTGTSFALMLSLLYSNNFLTKIEELIFSKDFDELERFTSNSFLETLRLHPPVPMIIRTIKNDLTYRDQLFKAGTSFNLQIHLIHRDKNRWKNSDSFDPYRSLSLAIDHFFPFGLGEKSCIGRHIAKQVIKTISIELFKKFKVINTTDIRLVSQFPTISIHLVPEILVEIEKREG